MKKGNQMSCHSKPRPLLLGCAPYGCNTGSDLFSGSCRSNKEEALNSFRVPLRSGFTLVELLIAVLIIGVLVAIAVPQYQKAVEKSKAAQAFIILRSLWVSANAYYLEKGVYPTSFSQIELKIPWTGKTQWGNLHVTDTISNEDWSLQLYHSSTTPHQLHIGRISGPYAGGGFGIQLAEPGRIWCSEIIQKGLVFKPKPGSYCEKIFHGTGGAGTYKRSYALP